MPPVFLLFMIYIGCDQSILVIKYFPCFLEGDFMALKIDYCFDGVPGKSISW